MELHFRSTNGPNSKACESRGRVSLNQRNTGIFQTWTGKVPPNNQNRYIAGWWEPSKHCVVHRSGRMAPLFILNFLVDIPRNAASFCEGDWPEWPVSELWSHWGLWGASHFECSCPVSNSACQLYFRGNSLLVLTLLWQLLTVLSKSSIFFLHLSFSFFWSQRTDALVVVLVRRSSGALVSVSSILCIFVGWTTASGWAAPSFQRLHEHGWQLNVLQAHGNSSRVTHNLTGSAGQVGPQNSTFPLQFSCDGWAEQKWTGERAREGFGF